MEGEESQTPQVEQPRPEKWYTPLTRVTPLSKYLALALFVVLPLIGFWLGAEYALHSTDFPVAEHADVSNDIHQEAQGLPNELEDVIASSTASEVEVLASSTQIYRNEDLGFEIVTDTSAPKVRKYTSTVETVSMSFGATEVLFTKDDSIERFEERMQQFPHVLFVDTLVLGEHEWRYYTNTGGSVPNHQYVLERGDDMYRIILDDTLSKMERDAIVASVSFFEPRNDSENTTVMQENVNIVSENVTNNDPTVPPRTSGNGPRVRESTDLLPIVPSSEYSGPPSTPFSIREVLPVTFNGLRSDLDDDSTESCADIGCTELYDIEYWASKYGNESFGGVLIRGVDVVTLIALSGNDIVTGPYELEEGTVGEAVIHKGDYMLFFKLHEYSIMLGSHYVEGWPNVVGYANYLITAMKYSMGGD